MPLHAWLFVLAVILASCGARWYEQLGIWPTAMDRTSVTIRSRVRKVGISIGLGVIGMVGVVFVAAVGFAVIIAIGPLPSIVMLVALVIAFCAIVLPSRIAPRHKSEVRGVVLAGAMLVAAVGVGIATSELLARALVAISSLIFLCGYVLPIVIAPSRTPANLADVDLANVEALTAIDRIQLADDRRKLQNDVRTSLFQALAGAVLLGSLLFTWWQQQITSRELAEQLEVTRQGQIGERFSRATQQLGSGNLDVRLGAIYELEQLASQDGDRRASIVEILAAYVRRHPSPDDNPPGLAVQAALTALGHLRDLSDSSILIDLHEAHLIGADLQGANLANADLRGADLSEANLIGADLSGAKLHGTDLTGADTRGAILDGADADDDTDWPTDDFDPVEEGVEVS